MPATSRSPCRTAERSRSRGRSTASTSPPTAPSCVTDHKTGSDRNFTAISDADPTASGTRLQLPSYAAAALAVAERPDAVVRAEYSFFAAGKYKRVGYTFTPDDLGRGGAVARPCGRRHRVRPLSGDTRTPHVAVVRAVRVLRTRQARHRRAVGRVGSQAPRSAAAALVRRPRRRRPRRRRRVSEQLSFELLVAPIVATAVDDDATGRRRARTHHDRSRHEPVRRGGCRRRQDDPARRAGPRARPTRACRSRRSRRSRSPRRPPPTSAIGCAAS